jgi:uncharacterized protein (DUF2267 family)
LKTSLVAGEKKLQQNGTAIEAVEAAIKVMEEVDYFKSYDRCYQLSNQLPSSLYDSYMHGIGRKESS